MNAGKFRCKRTCIPNGMVGGCRCTTWVQVGGVGVEGGGRGLTSKVSSCYWCKGHTDTY